jgi:hypothetical protein
LGGEEEEEDLTRRRLDGSAAPGCPSVLPSSPLFFSLYLLSPEKAITIPPPSPLRRFPPEIETRRSAGQQCHVNRAGHWHKETALVTPRRYIVSIKQGMGEKKLKETGTAHRSRGRGETEQRKDELCRRKHGSDTGTAQENQITRIKKRMIKL